MQPSYNGLMMSPLPAMPATASPGAAASQFPTSQAGAMMSGPSGEGQAAGTFATLLAAGQQPAPNMVAPAVAQGQGLQQMGGTASLPGQPLLPQLAQAAKLPAPAASGDIPAPAPVAGADPSARTALSPAQWTRANDPAAAPDLVSGADPALLPAGAPAQQGPGTPQEPTLLPANPPAADPALPGQDSGSTASESPTGSPPASAPAPEQTAAQAEAGPTQAAPEQAAEPPLLATAPTPQPTAAPLAPQGDARPDEPDAEDERADRPAERRTGAATAPGTQGQVGALQGPAQPPVDSAPASRPAGTETAAGSRPIAADSQPPETATAEPGTRTAPRAEPGFSAQVQTQLSHETSRLPGETAARAQPATPTRPGAEGDVAIAARSLDGLKELDVRMQAEMGRVDVRLSFPERGRLEAVIAADNPAALEMLRREGAELARALSAATPSGDGATLSFQSRNSDEQAQRRQSARGRNGTSTPQEEAPAEWRPMATSGRIERIA